jgi:hypothetical protein
MTPRRIAYGAVVLLVAGIVVGVVGSAVAVKAIGLTVAGIACVLLVAAACLAIGLAEERDRQRDGTDRPA